MYYLINTLCSIIRSEKAEDTGECGLWIDKYWLSPNRCNKLARIIKEYNDKHPFANWQDNRPIYELLKLKGERANKTATTAPPQQGGGVKKEETEL